MTRLALELSTLACGVTLALLLVSMLLVLVRLWRGPSTADRVVALDLFSVLVVAVLVVLAILRQESADLDVAIAYSLVAFLGTVALARYIHRRTGKQGRLGSGPRLMAGRSGPGEVDDD